MASPINPELQSQIAVWRQKSAEGTLTQDEMRQAIIMMRAGRLSASTASEQSRRKSAKIAIPSADDLLDELGA